MQCKEIIEVLEQDYSRSYALPWDNVGLLTGRADKVVKKMCIRDRDYSDQPPLQYYERGAARLGKMIHPETAALLHRLLLMLAEKGEEATFRFIREHKRELKKGRIPK